MQQLSRLGSVQGNLAGVHQINPPSSQELHRYNLIMSHHGHNLPVGGGYQKNNVPRAPHTNHAAARVLGNRSGDSNAHHQIIQRFNNKESIYLGSDEEHLQSVIDSYITTAEDYKLSATEKLRFLHNMFREDELRFYYIQINNFYSTVSKTIQAVNTHLHSPHVQKRDKADLSALSLTRIAD